ncbi:MAG: DUF2269 family protein [Actinomycetota bacterium]|nr:DUF2269 family protein [Actinomycetota bacterium]
MTLYGLYLAIHILAVVVWVGGTLTVQILATRANNSEDPARMAALAGDTEWVGMRVFMPASILALISGIVLVLDGHWGFGHFWILFGLFGILFSAVTGAAFIGPETGRLKKLIEDEGPAASPVRDRMQRIFLISRIELVILLLVVADMALKPGS